LRGEATEDVIELRVHMVCADERAVVDRSAEEQPAVSGEQLPSLLSGTGGELEVIGMSFIRRIDAE
jgi:hypothetical protein